MTDGPLLTDIVITTGIFALVVFVGSILWLSVMSYLAIRDEQDRRE